MSAAIKRQARSSAPRLVAPSQPNPLHELLGNVCGCLVVMRTALPGQHTQLTEGEASLHQVSARSMGEFLKEAADLAGSEPGPVGAMNRVRDLLMFSGNLVALLEAALWHVCDGRSDTDAEASLTGGDVAGTCALLEEHLAEAMALLRSPAPGAEGGAS